MPVSADNIRISDRVKVSLDSKFWRSEGWFEGTVVRIDPYSKHRQFYWVELDEEAQAVLGTEKNLISVFNPKNIRRV